MTTLPQRISRLPKWVRWLPTILLLVFLIGAIGFVAWASTPYGQLMPEVQQALMSDDRVTVTTRGWIAFVPVESAPRAGIVLYPGGRVQAEAYAPLARQIAEQGYLAAIVYVPLNLAFFDTNAANAVLDNYSAVSSWAVGGHSLGGVAAAIYATAHPQRVDGLALMGSFPADAALTTSDLDVVSIYASNDRLANPAEILNSAVRLPSSARFVEIAGGNHAQFGYYGSQSGDGNATITYAEQTEQTASAIVELLGQISN